MPTQRTWSATYSESTIADRNASEAVLQATNRGQEPWIYGSLGGDAVALIPAKQGLDCDSASRNSCYRPSSSPFGSGALAGAYFSIAPRYLAA